MISTPETIESRWRALIEAGRPEQREVDADSPLRMIVGVNALNQPYFFTLVKDRPGYPQMSSSITVEVRQRADGQWSLTLQLVDSTLIDAFISLVSELADKCSGEKTERDAMKIFLATLADWRQLLSVRRDRLSLEALRGLVAELWFGFESAAHGYSLSEAVQAWSGPLGGDQDFNFPTPAKQYEVKSIRPAGTSIEISSAEQLDRDDVNLAVITLEDLGLDARGLMLPEVVAGIRARIDDPTVRSDFNRRIAHLSIDLDDPWYRERRFGVRQMTIFDVSDDFPALRRSQLPNAVVTTNYRIDLQFIPEFILFDETFDVKIEVN